MAIGSEMLKLRQLHESGAISDEEYERAKRLLLSGEDPQVKVAGPSAPPAADAATDAAARQWAMILHFSQLAGYLAPLVGFVVPIVVWQMKKDLLPGIDEHGRAVTNWMISLVIYLIVSGVLVLVGIGVLLLIALGALAVIFPIVGGIKAGAGEVWRYPLSIRFF